MRPTKRVRLNLEHLEDRLVPAFNYTFNPSASTSTLTQVQDNGPVTVTVTPTNNLTLTENGNTTDFGPVGANLTINMLSNNDSLEVDLNNGLNGNLMISANNGARTITFGGTANSMGGNLTITAGSGDQTVELALNAPLNVGGSANINLGLSSPGPFQTGSGPTTTDQVLDTNGGTIGSNLTLRTNYFDHAAPLSIGSNYSQTVNSGGSGGFDALATGSQTNIGGSFTYTGGSYDDQLFLGDGASIGGSFYANLGTNYNTLFSQIVLLDNTDTRPDFVAAGIPVLNNPVFIGRGVTVMSGLNPYTTTDFLTASATNISGNISINYSSEGTAGGGANSASITYLYGTFGGGSISVTGGQGNDEVRYGMTGSRASLAARLGAGADTFQLDPGASLSYLYVDFGTGPGDKFINNYGRPFDFPATIKFG